MARKYKTALVVGGSRGMGKELALSLAANGTDTHVVARSQVDLDALRTREPSIKTVAKDATDSSLADDLISSLNPDLLILTVGATPKMIPFQTQNWEEFSAAWNADVKVAHSFMSAALTQPMAKGSTIVSFSSGAGLSGSRLSGGYAGAKRMQHFLAEYAQREADDLDLGLRFWSIIPKQLVQGTEKGHDAATAYAAAVGKPLDQFWAQWDNALTALGIAAHVIELLQKSDPLPTNTFAVTGQGISEL
jgi:short-subunit dehydrogenase